MRNAFLVLFILSSAVSNAQQFSSEVYHDGLLVTSERDTIRGQLKYDMETNVVSMILKGKIKTFSSHKIFYFEINDSVLRTFRQFYSIPYNVNYEYKIPILFELLYEGPLSLLARESIVQQAQTTSATYWGGTTSYPRTVVQQTYYFLDTEGSIAYYSGRKKDLLLIMYKKQNHVKKYIKDNRLDHDDVKDLIRIAAFYNSI